MDLEYALMFLLGDMIKHPITNQISLSLYKLGYNYLYKRVNKFDRYNDFLFIIMSWSNMPVKVYIRPGNAPGKWKCSLITPLMSHRPEIQSGHKSKNKKRLRWSDADTPSSHSGLVTKTEDAIVTDRIKVPTLDLFCNWRDFSSGILIENTQSNTHVFKYDNFTEHKYRDKQGILQLHPSKASIHTINHVRRTKPHLATDPIAFLSTNFISYPNDRDFTKYTFKILQECLDYIIFKISTLKEKGSTMICWARGLSATKANLSLLENCKTQIDTFLSENAKSQSPNPFKEPVLCAPICLIEDKDFDGTCDGWLW